MTRGNQTTIILFVMGLAIVLAAILTLAISTARNRPQAQPDVPEVVTINGQPITLRRNPELTVQLAPPEIAQPNQVIIIENEEPAPTAPPPTNPPPPTDTPVPTENNVVVPTNTPVPVVSAVNPVILIPYVVQDGDTLFSIRTNRATSIALMAEYGIAQDNIVPGTTIDLPVGNPEYCPGRRPYAVAEGETVFAISRKVNSTTQDLQAINNLGPDFAIQAGQILCVP